MVVAHDNILIFVLNQALDKFFSLYRRKQTRATIITQVSLHEKEL